MSASSTDFLVTQKKINDHQLLCSFLPPAGLKIDTQKQHLVQIQYPQLAQAWTEKGNHKMKSLTLFQQLHGICSLVELCHTIVVIL